MEPLLRSMQCETLSACRKGAVGLPGSAALGGVELFLLVIECKYGSKEKVMNCRLKTYT